VSFASRIRDETESKSSTCIESNVGADLFLVERCGDVWWRRPVRHGVCRTQAAAAAPRDDQNLSEFRAVTMDADDGRGFGAIRPGGSAEEAAKSSIVRRTSHCRPVGHTTAGYVTAPRL